MNPELDRNIRDHARLQLRRARAIRGKGTAREVQELNYEAMELLREYEDIVPPEVIQLFDYLLDRSRVRSVFRRQKAIDEWGYGEAIAAEARDPKIKPFKLQRIVAECRGGGEPRNYKETVEGWRKRPEWGDMLRRLRQYPWMRGEG